MNEITSEKGFEEKIRNLIQSRIIDIVPNLILFQSKKAVDVMICREGTYPKIFFIEIKYHKKGHGRLGFGSGKGVGFQPEILKLNPDYFDQNMLWILGSEDSEKFFLLKNSELIKYVSGGGISSKYNNIQNKLFKNVTGLSEEAMIQYLKEFFNS